MSFQVLPKKLHYEYVSILDFDQIIRNNSFFCKATNLVGTQVKSIKVDVYPLFQVVNVSKGIILLHFIYYKK